MPRLSQAAYAKHRGTSRQAVNKLVLHGRIPLEPDGTIDAAKADFALGEHRMRVNERKAAPTTDSNSAKLTLARAGDAFYAAKIRQLQYEKALGKALPLDGVVDAATICGETVVRIVRSLSMRAEEINAAGAREGIVGTRSALKLIERDLLARAGAAFEQMAAAATAAREATAPDADEAPLIEEEDEAA